MSELIKRLYLETKEEALKSIQDAIENLEPLESLEQINADYLEALQDINEKYPSMIGFNFEEVAPSLISAFSKKSIYELVILKLEEYANTYEESLNDTINNSPR
jgi:hypothetical protein